MQGGLISIAVLAAALAPSAAFAGEVSRRQVCQKIEPRAPTPPQIQQQRARAPECRTTRTVPPVVDPTPFFLL